jgi:hypothetical protein
MSSNIQFQRQSAQLSQFAQLDEQVFSGPLEAVVTAAVTLNAPQIRQARDNVLLVTPGVSSFDLSVGADTPGNAADLQNILGLVNAGDQCILRFAVANSNDIAADVNLVNDDGSYDYVKLQLRGSAADASAVILDTTETTANSPLALVLVTADNVTVGSEVITFNVVLPASVSS